MLPAHTKHTFGFKHVQGKPIELDVYVADARPTTPMPLMLYFHGGYIVSFSFGYIRCAGGSVLLLRVCVCHAEGITRGGRGIQLSCTRTI